MFHLHTAHHCHIVYAWNAHLHQTTSKASHAPSFSLPISSSVSRSLVYLPKRPSAWQAREGPAAGTRIPQAAAHSCGWMAQPSPCDQVSEPAPPSSRVLVLHVHMLSMAQDTGACTCGVAPYHSQQRGAPAVVTGALRTPPPAYHYAAVEGAMVGTEAMVSTERTPVDAS